MRHLPIRWRLTLWYAGSLGFLLAGFSLLLLLLARQHLLDRTDATLREELRELTVEIELARDDRELVRQLHDRFLHHDVYDFVVSDESGSVLFASAGVSPADTAALLSVAIESAPSFTRSIALGQHPCRVTGRVASGSHGPVVVQASTSLTPLYDELQALQILTLSLLPLGLGVALCGGYFLAARALAPVKEISRIADGITIAQLDRRIEVVNPHDEIGQLTTTLNGLIARLERAVAEIQRFTADASHELRTPLAALRAAAESSLRTPRTAAEYQKTLAIVIEEATRLGRLTDQLLSLSRHDAGISECRRENVRIDAILQDVVEQLRPLATKREVTIETPDLACCEVVGDDIRLSQALFNVLDNAIKYSPAGSCVTVECQVQNQTVVIEVTDQGVGIPPEHLACVFDRFYRVDASRQSLTGGAGLGLAIARSAIEVHAGEVDITSQPGVGTRVAIRLPHALRIDDGDPAPEREAHRESWRRNGYAETKLRPEPPVDESAACRRVDSRLTPACPPEP